MTELLLFHLLVVEEIEGKYRGDKFHSGFT